jgi:hypothetical protein
MLRLEASGPAVVRIDLRVSVPAMLSVIGARSAAACAGG